MSRQTQRWRGDPEKGADLEAPTAPHAEPRADRPEKLSGPARFWSTRRVRVALFVALLVSLSFHLWVSPWDIIPSTGGVAFEDPDGDIAIPIDLLAEEPPPPEPAATTPAPAPTAESNDPNAPGRDAGVAFPKKDAGIPLATLDAGSEADASVEDGGPTDGGVAAEEAGLVAQNDAGGGPEGPRDPEAMFGLSKVVNAGVQNIVLGVNVALIRKHPVGSRVGPILKVIPQWRDFLKDSPIEPIKDTEWILVYGPSLRQTARDAVLVKYNTSDRIVDATIGGIAKSYDKGGAFDAGVSGIPGSLGYADQAPRVFIRPQSKLLVIVPPSHAHEAALVYRKQTPRGPPPHDAVRLVMKHPGAEIRIPNIKFEDAVTEIRLWVTPRDDGGADLYFEGDCTDEAAAQEQAVGLTALFRKLNSWGVALATKGLLNGLTVNADGKKITAHQVASQEQLEVLLQLAAARFGVQVAPPAGAAPTSGDVPAPRPDFTRPNE